VGGPEHSTLSNDAFPSREFDFMLSNPPYGKSWKSDLERMGSKDGLKDPRFVIDHGGDAEYSLVTRSSDGQMLFLANMLSKMKQGTKIGSRIAEVHNGSSLFTGDAGQGGIGAAIVKRGSTISRQKPPSLCCADGALSAMSRSCAPRLRRWATTHCQLR